MKNKSAVTAVASIGSLLAWSAVVLQLWLLLQNRTTSVGESLVRFFSFFTILTNILAAVCLSTVAARGIQQKVFFSNPKTLSATTVYILVVGIVYNLVLRSLWSPQGLQKLVDETLHSVNPVYYLFFWMIFVPKQNLRWSDAFRWLLYPLGYLVYILLRGAASGFYPYPFVNVTELSFAKVMVNTLALLIAFLGLSLLFIGLGRLSRRGTKEVH